MVQARGIVEAGARCSALHDLLPWTVSDPHRKFDENEGPQQPEPPH